MKTINLVTNEDEHPLLLKLGPVNTPDTDNTDSRWKKSPLEDTMIPVETL
jgi:hypothetical protein